MSEPTIDHGSDGMNFPDIQAMIDLGLRVRCSWSRHHDGRSYEYSVRQYIDGAVVVRKERCADSQQILTLAPKENP
jgi:hypothetical protein